jgi:hypothetical protein
MTKVKLTASSLGRLRYSAFALDFRYPDKLISGVRRRSLLDHRVVVHSIPSCLGKDHQLQVAIAGDS